MGRLNTIVCAAIALSAALSGIANAQEAEPTTDRFTNRDLLEQPVRDQRIWLNGLILGIANGIGWRDPDAGRCMIDWHMADQEQSLANIRANLERFPDREPAIIVLALARRACPEIDDQR